MFFNFLAPLLARLSSTPAITVRGFGRFSDMGCPVNPAIRAATRNFIASIGTFFGMTWTVERAPAPYQLNWADLVDNKYIFKRPFVDEDRASHGIDSRVVLTISAYPAEPTSGDWMQFVIMCLLFFALAMLVVACIFVAAKLVRIRPRRMAPPEHQTDVQRVAANSVDLSRVITLTPKACTIGKDSIASLSTQESRISCDDSVARSSNGANLVMAAATRGQDHDGATIESLIAATSAMILELQAAADTPVSAFAPPPRTGRAVPSSKVAIRREARGKILISSLMRKTVS
ncbi:hypothetical protein EV175_000409 [Coemansia sp. RSA 1933]|nr:hypothetical protein EV175_000409 [Coemansia sp. RSA 1933]